jgi:predicted porin
MRFAHSVRFLCLPAAALAALIPSTPVFAQNTTVQMYGLVDIFAGRSATSGQPVRVQAVNSGGMTTSYWGIGGVENLGGTRVATFAVEGFFRADTGDVGRTPGEGMFTRAAYVGMNDTWGSVKIGRVPSPLFQTAALLNPYGFSTRLSPLMAQMYIVPYGNAVDGDSGWSNVVHYTSPTVGGFTAIAQYGLGEHANATSPGNNKVLVLKYVSPSLTAAVAAQDVGNSLGITAAGPSQRTYFAGAAYDFKVVKLFATFSRGRTELSERSDNTSHLALSVPQGAGRWMLAWARTNEHAKVVLPFHRNTAAAGYDYTLSLRTDLYAVYLYDKLSTTRSGNTTALGIRHRF